MSAFTESDSRVFYPIKFKKTAKNGKNMFAPNFCKLETFVRENRDQCSIKEHPIKASRVASTTQSVFVTGCFK